MGVQGPDLPFGSTRTTPAATASCPSRNTVADTWNVSPVTALAGRRPFWTTGRTSRTGIRPMTAPLSSPEGEGEGEGERDDSAEGDSLGDGSGDACGDG